MFRPQVIKALKISLAIIYLTFNAGVLVNLHYCGNSFDHFTIIIDPENCCEGDCSCCNNSSTELKMPSEYDVVHFAQDITINLLAYLPVSTFDNFMLVFDSQTLLDKFHPSGPLIPIYKQPRYLIHEVFII
jgi:hypothetical protein